MLGRVRAILKKEFIQMMRDPRMRAVMFVVPCVQMVLLGFAVSTDVKHVPTAVYDLDGTPQSRELAREFSGSEYFSVRARIGDDEEQRRLINTARVSAVVRVDRGFGRDLAGGKTARVQCIVDGTDSNSAGIILNYAARVVERFAARAASGRTQPGPSVELRSRAWFNENLESRVYFIPGVVTLVLFIITFLLTAMAVVREKETGTMEQLIVSPIRPLELIAGKIAPFALVGAVDLFVMLGAAAWFFGVPVRGSVGLLFVSSCLFFLTTLGLGLFISTRSDTQQEAMMTMFFVAQPMVLLSGFLFPIANMPAAVQWATYLDPLRYYLVIIRGVMLKGSGIGVLWPQMAALLVLGLGVLALSSLAFRRKLG